MAAARSPLAPRATRSHLAERKWRAWLREAGWRGLVAEAERGTFRPLVGSPMWAARLRHKDGAEKSAVELLGTLDNVRGSRQYWKADEARRWQVCRWEIYQDKVRLTESLLQNAWSVGQGGSGSAEHVAALEARQGLVRLRYLATRVHGGERGQGESWGDSWRCWLQRWDATWTAKRRGAPKATQDCEEDTTEQAGVKRAKSANVDSSTTGWPRGPETGSSSRGIADGTPGKWPAASNVGLQKRTARLKTTDKERRKPKGKDSMRPSAERAGTGGGASDPAEMIMATVSGDCKRKAENPEAAIIAKAGPLVKSAKPGRKSGPAALSAPQPRQSTGRKARPAARQSTPGSKATKRIAGPAARAVTGVSAGGLDSWLNGAAVKVKRAGPAATGGPPTKKPDREQAGPAAATEAVTQDNSKPPHTPPTTHPPPREGGPRAGKMRCEDIIVGASVGRSDRHY